MWVSRSLDGAASHPEKIKNTSRTHNSPNRRIMSCSQKAKCQGPETDTHRVSYRLHLGARLAIVVDHVDGSVRNGAARPCHLDQYFHLEFVAPAPQFGLAKFVQSEQPESTLAVPNFVADERRSQPAANDVREIAGARHEGAIETARANDQVRSSFFGDAKHDRDILRQMLAVAIEGDYVSEVVVPCESDARAQGRGLAAMSWQLQASCASSSRNVRRPIARSIVNDHNICNMLTDPFDNLGDVRGLVECRN